MREERERERGRIDRERAGPTYADSLTQVVDIR